MHVTRRAPLLDLLQWYPALIAAINQYLLRIKNLIRFSVKHDDIANVMQYASILMNESPVSVTCIRRKHERWQCIDPNRYGCYMILHVPWAISSSLPQVVILSPLFVNLHHGY